MNKQEQTKAQSFLIVSGGSVDLAFLEQLYTALCQTEKPYVVGVDRGCQSLLDLDIMINVALGDFDSIQPADLNRLKKAKVEMLSYAVEKDLTDTHLAFDYIKTKFQLKPMSGKKNLIYLVGATGSRWDHSLSNLMIGFSYLDLFDIHLCDNHNRAVLVRGKKRVAATDFMAWEPALDWIKPYLSVVPITTLQITTSSGLKYPLADRRLLPYDSLAISNQIEEKDFFIDFETGDGLVMISRD